MPPAIPPSDPSKHCKPASSGFSAHSVHPQAQTTRSQTTRSSQSNNTIFPSLGIFLPHQNIATRRRRSVRSRGAYISRLRFRAQPTGAVTRNALNVNGMPHLLMPLSCTEAIEGIMRSCLLLAGANCLRDIISRP